MNKLKNKTIVLVTAMGGDIGSTYAQSIAGEEFSVIGCDMNALVCQKSFLDHFVQVPAANNIQQYFDALRHIVEKNNIDVIVPISEPEIEAFFDNKAIWSSWNVKVLINNDCILTHFLDKYHTAKYLEKMGITVPQTYLLKEYAVQLDFPMIVKKRKGCGSKNIWKVESDIDLNYLKQKDDGTYLIQECIGQPDQEFTTGVFSDGKNVSSITFKRKLGFGGLSIEVELVDAPFMEEMARKIANQTHLIGSINIQTRLLDGKFIPFEINPRISSTVGFRKHFGFLDGLWWLRTSLGKTYSYQKQYKSGKAIRSLTESYSAMEPI